MDFAFSEEQELLRRSVRYLLAGNWPLDRVAELADGEAGWDPASLPRLAELGCLALSLPAERGAAADPAPLEATAAGERSATLAVAELDGPRTMAEAGASACVAKRDGDAWTL